MNHRTQLESLEGRQLLTFVLPNLSFGNGGFIATGSTVLSASQPPNRLYTLNDGRLIFREPNRLKFLHGDGAIDGKRADGGVLTIGSNELIAVDAGSGVIARVKQKSGETKATLTLYKPNGVAVRTAQFGSGTGVTYRSVAFTPDGGLVLAGSKLVATDATHQVASLVVRRFDGALQTISEFGTNGRASDLDSQTINSADGLDTFDYGTAFVDQSGRIYLPYSSRIRDGQTGDVFAERTLRLTATGAPDATYGTNGVVTVYQNDPNLIDGNFQPTTLDRSFDADGVSYVLWNSYNAGGEGVAGTTMMLSRISADGTITASLSVLPATHNRFPKTGRVAAGINGEVHVIAQDNGAQITQVRTYYTRRGDGSLGLLVDGDEFGEVGRMTFPFVPNDVAATAGNTIIMSGLAIGTGTPALYSVNVGSQTDYSYGKAVDLHPDGTLVVHGTPGNDVIQLSQKHDVVRVTLNGGKAVTFAARSIRGIVVKGNKGNDRVDLQATFMPAVIEGGAGDDTLHGSDAAFDTIFGNAGNDEIEGRGADDQLAGDEGDDILLGGRDADWLLGGTGDDRLYASGFARDTHPSDSVSDTLTGGAGADLFRTDIDKVYPASDAVTDDTTRDGDRVVT